MADARLCSIEGCGKPHRSRGWCSKHYQRWIHHGDPLVTLTRRGEPPAFIEDAIHSSVDECIIWPFVTNQQGYGRFRVNGVLRSAHIVVLERTAGPMPSPGMVAAHAPSICHNPSCVNPRHLRWATLAENNADRYLDGTAPAGERHQDAKLTDEIVRKIRRDRNSSHEELADRYGVKPVTIRHARSGRTWRHLD